MIIYMIGLNNLKRNSMEKIPTAEEFYTQITGCVINHSDIKTAMIEFAAIHVEAALKAASENVDYTTDGQEHITDVWIDKNSILNSYSLDNIK